MRRSSCIAVFAAALLAACEAPQPAQSQPEQPQPEQPQQPQPVAANHTAGSAGWPVVYEQRFQRHESVDDFSFTDESAWQWHDGGGLELLGKSKYRPPKRSPTSIALLKDLEVADFDLDVDLKQTGRNYGHRDMCLFFGFQSKTQFYYTHMATSPDQNAHNIFRVDNAPRTNIAPVAKQGIDWGNNVWHHIHVERRVKDGSIRVYWDNQTEPILSATDTTFDWGRIGFGSFDDSGIVANIVVRAPATRSPRGKRNPFAR